MHVQVYLKGCMLAIDMLYRSVICVICIGYAASALFMTLINLSLVQTIFHGAMNTACEHGSVGLGLPSFKPPGS